jgi:hypothetical protein
MYINRFHISNKEKRDVYFIYMFINTKIWIFKLQKWASIPKCLSIGQYKKSHRICMSRDPSPHMCLCNIQWHWPNAKITIPMFMVHRLLVVKYAHASPWFEPWEYDVWGDPYFFGHFVKCTPYVQNLHLDGPHWNIYVSDVGTPLTVSVWYLHIHKVLLAIIHKIYIYIYIYYFLK